MVATVGSIAVDLTVNGAKFEAGFKKAGTTVERESSRMAKSVGQAQKAFTGFIGSFGGIGSLGALAGIASFSGAMAKARQALADFDDIAKQSRLTGLSTDMFQALSFGALEASVSQETLNKSLEVFAKNVGLAKNGQGALVSGLKELNPQLLQNILNAKNQEERLKLVADAMSQLGSASSRAALATTVFGKGGLEMVEILGKGAAAIDDFKKRAADMGLIVPDDLLQRAGELDDKLVILAKVIDVNLNQALVNLAPALVGAAEGMAGFSQDLNKSASALTAFVNNPSLDTFMKFLASPAGLQVNIGEGGIADWFRDLAATSKRTAASVVSDIEAVKSQIKALEALGKGIGAEDLLQLNVLREELVRLNYELRAVDTQPVKDVGTAADVTGDKVEAAADKVADLGDEIDDLHDKTVTITIKEHTVRTTSGGTTSIGVTSHTVDPATYALTNPIRNQPYIAPLSASSSASNQSYIDPTTGNTINVTRHNNQLGSGNPITNQPYIDPLAYHDTFAAGGFTGHRPANRIAGVVHGGEYVMDAASTRAIGVANLDAIRGGVRGYADGGSVGTVGGRSVLGMIEDNTYQAVEEIRRAVGYLETMEKDGQTAISLLREIQSGIRSVGASVSSGSSSSSSVSSGSSDGAQPIGRQGYSSGYGGLVRNDTAGLYAGYATGGMIHPGDTQQVQFFKNPNEAVGVFRPEQMDAIGNAMGGVAVHYYAAPGNPDPSPRAMMELQDRIRATVRDVMGGL